MHFPRTHPRQPNRAESPGNPSRLRSDAPGSAKRPTSGARPGRAPKMSARGVSPKRGELDTSHPEGMRRRQRSPSGHHLLVGNGRCQRVRAGFARFRGTPASWETLWRLGFEIGRPVVSPGSDIRANPSVERFWVRCADFGHESPAPAARFFLWRWKPADQVFRRAFILVPGFRPRPNFFASALRDLA